MATVTLMVETQRNNLGRYNVSCQTNSTETHTSNTLLEEGTVGTAPQVSATKRNFSFYLFIYL